MNTCRLAVLIVALAVLISVTAAGQVSNPPDSKHTTVFGQTIHYLEAGSGTPVILLHGLADDAAVWTDTIPALAGRFHVYALDQIGFGESDKPLIPYRVQTLVDFLYGFFRAVHIEHATLVGNSLGGCVAARFAIQHPHEVDKLVLVDSAGYWSGVPLTREWLAQLNPSTLEQFRRTLGLVIGDRSLITDKFVEDAWTAQLKHGDGYTISQFLSSFLRRDDELSGRAAAITRPTLVVWGREDRLLPLAQGRQFVHDIHGARLVILDRCGHMPQVECPEALNGAMLKFLESEPARERQ